MKLIDAEQCPCYKCGATCPYNHPLDDCKKFSYWILGTAYDVDKVVEDLESLNPVDYGSPFSYEGHSCARELKTDAIDIVKRGGVDD